MDIAMLAAAAVAASVPFLGHMADGAAEKLGEKAVETGGKLAKWLRSRARGETATTLAKLETAPTDVALKAKLKGALRRQLEASPSDATELKILLQQNPNFTLDNRGGVYNVAEMTGVAINSSGISINVSR